MVVVVEGRALIVACSQEVVLVMCPGSCPVERILALAPLLLKDDEVAELEKCLESRGTAL